MSEVTRSDAQRVQRASLQVALWVGLTSVAVLGLITAVTLAVLVLGSRPARRPGRPGERRVIDVADIVPLVVVVAVIGVLVLSLVAWYLSRRMALPLAEALAVQRRFVADASHELRTPLTTLTSRIQLAQHRAERGGDVAGALEDLRRDAAVMDAVLDDLLVAAENAGSRPDDRDAVAVVADAVGAAVDVVAPGAERVTIAQHVAPGLLVAADGTALTRAIIALLDNAVRHSPAGGVITVSAVAAGDLVALRVADQGTGVRGVDPARLFDRFVRAEPDADHGASSRRGFGLGLALVRDIAERFGGRIRLERTGPAGTTFLLELPAVRR